MTGDNVSATVCITLGIGYKHTAAWIPIGTGSTGAYVYGDAANYEVRSGTLSETVDGQATGSRWRQEAQMRYPRSSFRTLCPTKTLADAAHHSVIVEQSIRVSDESDGVNNLSRNYG